MWRASRQAEPGRRGSWMVRVLVRLPRGETMTERGPSSPTTGCGRPGGPSRGSSTTDALHLPRPGLAAEGPMPCTNNRIEGGTNAKIKGDAQEPQGMSLTRRIKAAFWLCCMDTECPKPAAEVLGSMPTDDDIDLLRDLYGTVPKDPLEPCEWGSGWSGRSSIIKRAIPSRWISPRHTFLSYNPHFDYIAFRKQVDFPSKNSPWCALAQVENFSLCPGV